MAENDNEFIVEPPKYPPNLIVILKPEGGVRAGGADITSNDPDVDVSELGEILRDHGAILKPLFGPSEDRVKLKQLDTLKTVAGNSLRGREDPSAQDELERVSLVPSS
jgi:hypothetical protein